jgi:chemotaxis signal transduction protein
MHIPREMISSPPAASLKFHNQFVRNIGRNGDNVQLLLDLEKFLDIE